MCKCKVFKNGIEVLKKFGIGIGIGIQEDLHGIGIGIGFEDLVVVLWFWYWYRYPWGCLAYCMYIALISSGSRVTIEMVIC